MTLFLYRWMARLFLQADSLFAFFTLNVFCCIYWNWSTCVVERRKVIVFKHLLYVLAAYYWNVWLNSTRSFVAVDLCFKRLVKYRLFIYLLLTYSFPHHDINGETCSICLDEFKEPRELVCRHVFCKDCIEEW